MDITPIVSRPSVTLRNINHDMRSIFPLAKNQNVMFTHLILKLLAVSITLVKPSLVINHTQPLFLSLLERQQFENSWPPILWPGLLHSKSVYDSNKSEHPPMQNQVDNPLLQAATLFSLENIFGETSDSDGVLDGQDYDNLEENDAKLDLEDLAETEKNSDVPLSQHQLSSHTEEDIIYNLESFAQENSVYFHLVIEMHLEELVVDLYGFMNNTCFRLERFQILKQRLRTELAQLDSLVALLHYNAKQLADQLSFATYIFTIMEDSSDILVRHVSAGQEQHWALYIIQLHIRMLMLPQLGALKSLKNYEYANVIKLHIEYMLFWVRLFKYIPNVPLATRLMFELHLGKARLLFTTFTCAYYHQPLRCIQIDES